MKKLFVLSLSCIVSFGLVGCKNVSTSSNTTQKISEQQTEKKVESKYKFPEGVVKVGKCNIITRTPSGTSENGNIPILFTQKDTYATQVGIDLENFQGDKEVFLFVNKIFSDKTQGCELTQTSLNIDEDNLKTGEYTVSAIQFENNDPNGKVVEYSEAKYKVQQSE